MAEPKNALPLPRKTNILTVPPENKQNRNSDNCKLGGAEKDFGRRKMEILRDSALLALVEKNDIIEGLMHASQPVRSQLEEELMEEVAELRERVAEMEEEGREMEEEVGRWQGRLAEERQQWNEEYARLQEERETLQNYIEEQQTDNTSLAQQLQETLQQNAQLISELTDAQLAYRYLKEAIAQPQPLPNPSPQPSPSSAVQLLDSPQQEDSECIVEQLSYTQEQWQESNLSIEKEMEEMQHCLKGSLRAINLIDNYSVHPHPSDSESQFTARYFKYPTDPTDRTYLHCSHIPEENEEEPPLPTHHSWIERGCWLAGGVCAGVVLGWGAAVGLGGGWLGR